MVTWTTWLCCLGVFCHASVTIASSVNHGQGSQVFFRGHNVRGLRGRNSVKTLPNDLGLIVPSTEWLDQRVGRKVNRLSFSFTMTNDQWPNSKKPSEGPHEVYSRLLSLLMCMNEKVQDQCQCVCVTGGNVAIPFGLRRGGLPRKWIRLTRTGHWSNCVYSNCLVISDTETNGKWKGGNLCFTHVAVIVSLSLSASRLYLLWLGPQQEILKVAKVSWWSVPLNRKKWLLHLKRVLSCLFSSVQTANSLTRRVTSHSNRLN